MIGDWFYVKRPDFAHKRASVSLSVFPLWVFSLAFSPHYLRLVQVHCQSAAVYLLSCVDLAFFACRHDYWHVMRAQSTLSNIIPVTTRHLKIFHISFLFVLVAYHNFLLFYSKFCLLFTCDWKIEVFIKIIIDKKLHIMKKKKKLY